MAKPQLRIFTYLPNPRLYKATITGRLLGVDIEIRGDKPPALANWLWDYDAVPLDEAAREAHSQHARKARTGFGGTLYKTDAFLAAHPYGTVPAAFGEHGNVGIFESNSIMRAVARLGGEGHTLYGDDALSASRIDSFLDTSLVFARDSQIYLLGLMKDESNNDIYRATQEALAHWLGGIEAALGVSPYICGQALTLADICFAAEVALMHNEFYRRDALKTLGLEPMLTNALERDFPATGKHFRQLCAEPAFAADLDEYLQKMRTTTSAPNAL